MAKGTVSDSCRKSSLSCLLHRLNQTKNGLTLDQMRRLTRWMVHRVQVYAVDAACRQVADLFGRVGDTRLFKQRGVTPPLVKHRTASFQEHAIRTSSTCAPPTSRSSPARCRLRSERRCRRHRGFVHESKEILVVVEQLGDEVAYARVDLLFLRLSISSPAWPPAGAFPDSRRRRS